MVSPYLFDVLEPGDQLEMRGPIGGYFAWKSEMGGPILMIAGGSGVVPLWSMLRHRSATASSVPCRLLYSARSEAEIIYRHELAGLSTVDDVEISFALTRSQPPDWSGYRRRIDAQMLADVAWPTGDGARTYVCGPTGFVEVAASTLVDLGHAPESIRTERFGPT